MVSRVLRRQAARPTATSPPPCGPPGGNGPEAKQVGGHQGRQSRHGHQGQEGDEPAGCAQAALEGDKGKAQEKGRRPGPEENPAHPIHGAPLGHQVPPAGQEQGARSQPARAATKRPSYRARPPQHRHRPGHQGRHGLGSAADQGHRNGDEGQGGGKIQGRSGGSWLPSTTPTTVASCQPDQRLKPAPRSIQWAWPCLAHPKDGEWRPRRLRR
jgi:hypothetical protein